MFQKKALFPVILVLVLSIILSACSSTASSGTVLPAQSKTSDPAKMAVVDKLGVGILKMEGTSQAVTTDQASALLPLWMAVYKMGNDQTASQAEVTALYEQIEETLTTEQVGAIAQITWTQEELNQLKQKYGSAPVGQSASASTSSSSSSSSAGGPGAGGPPMGGGGGPMDDITSVGGSSSQATTTGAKTSSSTGARTSNPTASSSLNPIFANAVITVLKKRTNLE